jgi:DNA-directed RNA polymerase subunit RPC12/RpoP
MEKKRFTENQGFRCANCQAEVLPLSNGSYRNHCPFCLHSLHVDLHQPGDRQSPCRGLMKPVDLIYTGKKGYQILFVCSKCGQESRNRAAIDDPVMPDDIAAIARLASQRGMK